MEAFIDFLDSLYYQGYAEHLAITDREAFNFEFNQFKNNYNI